MIVGTKFTIDNFDFLDQIYPKRVFPVKTENVNTTIDFCIFKLI